MRTFDDCENKFRFRLLSITLLELQSGAYILRNICRILNIEPRPMMMGSAHLTPKILIKQTNTQRIAV